MILQDRISNIPLTTSNINLRLGTSKFVQNEVSLASTNTEPGYCLHIWCD